VSNQHHLFSPTNQDLTDSETVFVGKLRGIGSWTN